MSYCGVAMVHGEKYFEVKNADLKITRFKTTEATEMEQYLFYLWQEDIPFRVERKTWR